MRLNFMFLLLLITTFSLFGQSEKQMTSGEIYKSLERFNFLGNALFVAAHPDDENTRLISYLVNEKNAHTTYLSLTRGDGGQNLIGPEISELLGVIRTQELLAARRVDGGHQMFTRANDFGYSKNAEETISIWDDELVKKDVVWAIRKLKPDVIINRFDHTSSGRTHGHHTASAMLSFELFERAANPAVYPDQLQYVDAWEARRLFFNTSWWFYGSRENFEKADKSNMVSVDVGTYYPLLGKSNNEIAAESRSNHKCQGFGSTGSRGSQSEYLQLLKGDMPSGGEDVFQGINTTWTRLKGGEIIDAKMKRVMDGFSFVNPALSVPALVDVYALLDDLDDDFWKERKKQELSEIIASCLGLYVEAISSVPSVVAGNSIDIDIEVTKRLKGDLRLESIRISPNGKDTLTRVSLNDNEAYFQRIPYLVSADMKNTAPYWLEEEGSLGMYKVADQQLIGLPETPRPVKVDFTFLAGDKTFVLSRDVSYKYNSPEDGEVFQPFEITPPAFVDVIQNVSIFPGELGQRVAVTVKSGKNELKGRVALPLPNGWSVQPAFFDFELSIKGQSQVFEFTVTPPPYPSDIKVNPEVTVDGQTYLKRMATIDYDHIPLQTVLMPATLRLVKIDLKKAGQNVGYIMGAGDAIPECIRQIGYDVQEIKVPDINQKNLNAFDAVVVGIRAYNTLDDLKFKQAQLLKYVEEGGTLIVQYNTSRGLVTEDLGPFPLKLSRDRVSVEEAEIRVLDPEHSVMNFPNKITGKDFDGWVQERGLYFPDEYGPEYREILSCNDPGEEPKNGGLLVAEYGRGYYVYTGYSWFRQLPAGVPGAYRLFTNLLSLGKDHRP